MSGSDLEEPIFAVFLRLLYTALPTLTRRKAFSGSRCAPPHELSVFLSFPLPILIGDSGLRNDENRANIPHLDRGLVDGTMKCGIKADRKLSRNNTSGVRGVHFDRQRGLWVAQIMFQHNAYLLGRFKHKRDAINARKEGEKKYFGKYRS